MKHPDERLVTPIYVKTQPEFPWPKDESVFYVLSRNGLFLCRNHEFFRSCVPARACPGELAAHSQFLKLRCPKVPQRQLELIVGFFSEIAEIHGSEAAVVLLWDRVEKRMLFRVPEQRATVTEGWTGSLFAGDVKYDIPEVSNHLSIVGTAHSHVDGAAYSSHIDRQDEEHMAGLHIVVGRIREEPPEVHCEYVIDGIRFAVDPASVLAGYAERSPDVPAEWIDRVKVKVHRYYSHDTYRESSCERGWYQGNPK